MKFRRPGPRLGLLAASWLASAQTLLAANVFLAPRLTLESGYDNNRFAMSASLTNAEGSAFLRATPALNLHLLADDGSEWAMGASATRTEYLRGELESRDGAEAHLEWWRTALPLEGGLRLAGGFARDQALPEDDLRWVSAVPTLRWTLPSPDWQLTAQARLDLADYDTRRTSDGDAQRDITTEIRPGLRWLPSSDLVLWSEVVLENNDSNEEYSRYQGIGLAIGASYWLSPHDQLAASFQAGARAFETATDAITGAEIDRRDAPLSAEIFYTHRLFPWLDLFCSASWQTTGSDQPEQDVDTGSIQIGATVAQDFELFSR